jgi:hypothetical protein
VVKRNSASCCGLTVGERFAPLHRLTAVATTHLPSSGASGDPFVHDSHYIFESFSGQSEGGQKSVTKVGSLTDLLRSTMSRRARNPDRLLFGHRAAKADVWQVAKFGPLRTFSLLCVNGSILLHFGH